MSTPPAALADTLALLEAHPKARTIAERALAIEAAHADDQPNEFGWRWDGWEFGDIPAHATTLRYLVAEGLLRITFQSRRATQYRLADPAAVRDALSVTVAPSEPADDLSPAVPDDLFGPIVGLDAVKSLFRNVLAAATPTDGHVLLVGGPGSAKSLFLDELLRLRPSHLAVGGGASRAGLAHLFIGPSPPRYLIVDEIARGTDRDLGVLLKLMSEGVISLTLHGRTVVRHVPTWVFAAANDITGLPRELVDRFSVVSLNPYTDDEFLDVATGVMVLRRGLDPEDARAAAVVALSAGVRSIRAAVRAGVLGRGDPARVREYLALVDRL